MSAKARANLPSGAFAEPAAASCEALALPWAPVLAGSAGRAGFFAALRGASDSAACSTLDSTFAFAAASASPVFSAEDAAGVASAVASGLRPRGEGSPAAARRARS